MLAIKIYVSVLLISMAQKRKYALANGSKKKPRPICARGVQRLKGASSESLCDAETLLRQIMARNKDSMMKMSYMQLQNKELANIAVSNIFMVVYKRLYKYPGIENFIMIP